MLLNIVMYGSWDFKCGLILLFSKYFAPSPVSACTESRWGIHYDLLPSECRLQI